MTENPPIVFIHGYKGAPLVDETGKWRFLTVLQAIGLQNSNLTLPLEWEETNPGEWFQRKDGLKVLDGQALEYIGGIFPIYAPIIKALNSLQHRTVRIFTYDWRRSNYE